MDPVRQTQTNSKPILWATIAAVAFCLLSLFLWRYLSGDPIKTPLTAAEMESRLIETGREEPISQNVKKPQPSDALLQQAQEALALRQPEKALQLADEMLAADAKNYIAYVLQGRSYASLGKKEQAVKALQQAIKLNPDAPESYLYLGHLYKTEKKYDEALKDYGQALALNPGMAAAYYHRGDIYLKQEEYEAARVEFNLAISSQTGSKRPLPTPYYKRGYLLYITQEYKLAIKDLSRAIELAPEMYEAYLYRANALMAIGRKEAAMRDYDQLIRIKPDFALGYYGRALLLREQGLELKSNADFKQADELGIKPALK